MLKKVLWLLSCFLLFGLPFVIFPFGSSFFEIPKVIVAETVIEVILLLAIFQNINYSFAKKPVFPSILLLIGLLSILQIGLEKSNLIFFGNVFRLQGVFLLWHLLLWSFLSSKIVLTKISWTMSFAVLLLLTFSSLLFGFNQADRAVGFAGEPNAFAACLIFIWPFVLFGLKEAKIKNWYCQILPFLSMLTVLGLTRSRSGLVAFVIQILFLFLVFKSRLKLKSVLFICLILYALTLFLPLLESNQVWENRTEIWQTAFVAGLQHPFIGSGFGNTQTAIRREALAQKNSLRFQYVDSAHNLWLDWWVQGGITGLGFIFFLILLTFINFCCRQDLLQLTQLLGLLIAASFNPLSVVSLVAFWWLIGQGFRAI